MSLETLERGMDLPMRTRGGCTSGCGIRLVGEDDADQPSPIRPGKPEMGLLVPGRRVMNANPRNIHDSTTPSPIQVRSLVWMNNAANTHSSHRICPPTPVTAYSSSSKPLTQSPPRPSLPYHPLQLRPHCNRKSDHPSLQKQPRSRMGYTFSPSS